MDVVRAGSSHTGGTGAEMDVDAITARECLMGTITGQIRARGYFVAELDPNPPQALIDVRWAGQMAGRLIGCRTETYASGVGARVPRKITVVVAPVRPSRDGWGFDARVRSVVQDLLQLRTIDHPTRRSA